MRNVLRLLALAFPAMALRCVALGCVALSCVPRAQAQDGVQPHQISAQTADGSAPSATNTALKPPASPAPPDTTDPTPEHIAKARQLILATGISRSFQIIIPEFMEQIGSALTQQRQDLVPDMDVVLHALRPEFDRQSDEMIDQSARIYASLLSEQDIDSILAFFASDAGKKYVGAQPLFLNQLVSGMQAWQQKISINMMSRVREEMKKKGHAL